MRTLLPLLVTVTACGSGIVQQDFRAVTPTPADNIYSCVMAVTDSMGYTIRSSDRVSGFLNAQKTSQGATTRDAITATILKQSDGRSELHLTAESQQGVARRGGS